MTDPGAVWSELTAPHPPNLSFFQSWKTFAPKSTGGAPSCATTVLSNHVVQVKDMPLYTL
ncbi:hypothetical protein I0C86_20020 [Plantactinospora sp. S1510]|uniref:Uncharacterized protein n=1 Tax=Plantactinospora alkalitolerans TaxID=2789879 RepID=A0ABS0GYE7_9ACTN|nr:hypothetical protein [Plantactinospora alkalitolerans]MBF9131230.1 hypothetical protein [Plantactinospora alkalitolerans]